MSLKQKIHLRKLAEKRRGQKMPEVGKKLKRMWIKKNELLPVQEKQCIKCGNLFRRTLFPPRKHFPNGVLETYGHFLKRKYCSLYCARHSDEIKISSSHKGKNNFNWKGGRTKNPAGYIHIWQPYHPFANKDGYVLEHRLIMEKKIGRLLSKSETVHHINGIKDDNRTENLRLFRNNGFHLNHHLGKIA